jgi:hypothetical protein
MADLQAVRTVPAHWHVDRLGERPLTVNKARRLSPFEWASYIRHERSAWRLLTLRAKVPHVDRARVLVTPLHRDARSPQDVAACAPAVKAAIDGIVDAGVLDDDDAGHLVEITFRRPHVCGRDGLRLTIVEAA